ncbi:MAG: endonuclease/exonuclease/phosphatase family protein [Bacteroidales bacterium]|nr:endonuclease/exonuclease/phosphatase family protein [Bacteroidales bacterium]MCF8333207.1 endonuclease/exonuclease/phosphatase family protein [Bacteroidales bacterium]
MNKNFLAMTLLLFFLVAGCQPSHEQKDTLRVATFNTALYRDEHGVLKKDLQTGSDEQIQIIARIIQHIRPDVLALQEFDYDPRGDYLKLFKKNYLEKSWNGSQPIEYRYAMAFPSNTGLPTSFDFNNDGTKHSPEDAYGYGEYPGQYAFAILSKYPLDTSAMRTFQKFLWKDMPSAVLPLKKDSSSYYSEKELEAFRLSSKNHVDLPVQINGKAVHMLIAHPTPPVFDGEENRNGKRNHDEIRLFADYISGEKKAEYLYDDEGNYGGLDTTKPFVIMGDMNADPERGETYRNPIMQLLENPQVNQKAATGKWVPSHRSKEEGKELHTTSVFDMRIDYVLPSDDFKVKNSGVFWPKEPDSLYQLTKGEKGSDHRMVWMDVQLKQP